MLFLFKSEPTSRALGRNEHKSHVSSQPVGRSGHRQPAVWVKETRDSRMVESDGELAAEDEASGKFAWCCGGTNEGTEGEY